MDPMVYLRAFVDDVQIQIVATERDIVKRAKEAAAESMKGLEAIGLKELELMWFLGRLLVFILMIII